MSLSLLSATDLNCAYGDRVVFAGVSLTLRAGELLAVLGPNGAGKTTLLKALAGHVRQRSGRVELEGQDVAALGPARVARQVAFAPQVLAPVWPLTVRELAALGRAPHRGWWLPLTRDDWRAVDAALDRLGLGPLRDRPVTELSGGEWQRARLAQALAQGPKVLLLDEPTAHLDPRYQIELLASVRDLARERSLAAVLTLHDLNLVGPWADRAVLLASGGVVAEGPPDRVLTAEALSAAYGVALAVAPHPLTGAPAVSYAPRRP